MLEHVAAVEERDVTTQPLSVTELDQLIGKQNYLGFLNTRNELYRERNMKDNPPSRAEALRLMSENPSLIRRPILIVGDKMVVGFNEDAWLGIIKAK